MAVPEQLTKVIQYLQTFRKQVSDAALTPDGSRPWMDFKDVQEAGQFDFPSLQKIFDVAKADDDYANARATEGRTRDVQTAKIGANLLMGLNRDFRQRTRSPIRSFIHAAARALGDEDPKGALRLHSLGWLERLAGATDEDDAGEG